MVLSIVLRLAPPPMVRQQPQKKSFAWVVMSINATVAVGLELNWLLFKTIEGHTYHEATHIFGPRGGNLCRRNCGWCLAGQ